MAMAAATAATALAAATAAAAPVTGMAGAGAEAEEHMATILCCVCGAAIHANPANMCVSCVRQREDAAEGIAKQVVIAQCRGCQRWLGPPWVSAPLESRELLTLCLKKIRGLSGRGVRLIDAGWIWTEPHSKRLRLRVTVQKEVLQGTAVLQQNAGVEFVVRNQQCDACNAVFTSGTWKAVVQVRQRVDHKRTFLYLEQLILKHNAHRQCINIETFRDGMDFYYSLKNQAVRFVDFLQAVVPCRVKQSKKLISADNHSNIQNFKFTFMVEITPICKDDLLALPSPLARTLSDISPLVLVQRISNRLHFVDPVTCERADMSAEQYWNNTFAPLLNTRQLTRFVVLGLEPRLAPIRVSAKQQLKKHKGRRRGGAGGGTMTAAKHATEETEGSTGKKRRRDDDDDGHAGTHETSAEEEQKEHAAGDDEEGVPAASAAASRAVKPSKLRLAEVTVAREDDFGHNDTQFVCLTHLGNILRTGDTVLGYDLQTSAVSEALPTLPRSRGALPDVVLVRKVYDKERFWELRTFEADVDATELDRRDAVAEAAARDQDMFIDELEADKTMRAQVNLYRRVNATGEAPVEEEGGLGAARARSAADEGEEEDEEGEDEEAVQWSELLDGLTISDAPPDAEVSDQVFAPNTAPAPAIDPRDLA